MTRQARFPLALLCLFAYITDPQSTSAQPHSTDIEILPAVELVFQTEPGRRYRIQRSTNLTSWENIEGLYEGTGKLVRRFQSATPRLPMFYRLQKSRDLQLPRLLSGKGGIIFDLGSEPSQILTVYFDRAYRLNASQFQGVTEQGQIASTNRLGDSLIFTVLPSDPANASFRGSVQLDFVTHAAGSITLTRSNGSISTGSFHYFDGELPFIEGTRRYATNLTGKRLQLAYEGGFAETFEFTSGSTLLYGNGAEAGTYTYTVGQDTIDGDMTGRLKIQLDNSWGYDITFYPGSFSSVSLLDVGSTPVFDVAYHIFY